MTSILSLLQQLNKKISLDQLGPVIEESWTRYLQVDQCHAKWLMSQLQFYTPMHCYTQPCNWMARTRKLLEVLTKLETITAINLI